MGAAVAKALLLLLAAILVAANVFAFAFVDPCTFFALVFGDLAAAVGLISAWNRVSRAARQTASEAGGSDGAPDQDAPV